MKLLCDEIGYGQPLRNRWAKQHKNLSPPLKWSGAPKGTVEFALICDDPDASGGVWTHWLIWGLPATATELPQGVAKTETVASLGGVRQGRNDSGNLGYDGPQPPSGTHRYFFRLYALSAPLGLAPGASAQEVRAALEGKVLAAAETMGTYSR